MNGNSYYITISFIPCKSNSSNCLNLSLFYLYICTIQQLSIYFFKQTLQQYSLFHSLFYLNIFFYSFISFKYYIFYSLFIIISHQQLTEITNGHNQILPTHRRCYHRKSTQCNQKPPQNQFLSNQSQIPKFQN
jgi:hypothetical protein